MRNIIITVCALFGLLVASESTGATSIEALRSAAENARRRVSELRSEQSALQQKLNDVAARIETLKTQRRGRLVASKELNDALRHSQDLSGTLTEIAQKLSSAVADMEHENLALLSAISSNMTALRSEYDRTANLNQRKNIIARMRALRAEREQLRLALPVTSIPALQTSDPADDPENLLEQADTLRDNEDKLRRELAGLERRIAEAREERDLDRRVNEFISDEAIFDDQDRRLRLHKGSEKVAAGDNRADRSAPENGPLPATQPGEAFGDTATAGPTGTPLRGFAPSAAASQPTRAADARPQVGAARRSIFSDDDLENLEAQRARLKGLADEMKTRAEKLEERARILK